MRPEFRLLRRALSAGLVAACLWATPASYASPLPHLSGYEAVGSGTLRFLGLRIYDATLWSPRGVWTNGAPFALELRYARSFDGAAIARRSIEEIRAQRNVPDALGATDAGDLSGRPRRRPAHRRAPARTRRRVLSGCAQARPHR
jgi:hypothetical protein